MLAALVLAAAPVGPLQGGPTGAVALEDPGLVLHLTGDFSKDHAELERAGLQLSGFKQRFGSGRWSMAAATPSLDRPTLTSLVGFELGPTSSFEDLVRPRGRALSIMFGDHGLRLASFTPAGEPLRRTQFEWSLGPPPSIEDSSHIELTIEPTAFDPAGSTWTEVETVVPADRWTHVALVRDRATTGTVRLVVDGVATVHQLSESPEDARPEAGESRSTWRLDVRLSTVRTTAGLDLSDLRIYDRHVSTTELSERQHVILGHVDVPTTLSGQRLDTPEAWAAGFFEHAVPDSAGVDWASAHWTQDRPVPGPHARTCHAVVPAGPGRLLVFGGELRDTHAGPMANGDDTWLYHLDEQCWERVAGGVTGRTSAELGEACAATLEAELADPQPAGSRLHPVRPGVVPDFTHLHGPAPDPRCHQGMAYDATTNTAFLLGGWFNAPDGGRLYDDVWLLDLDGPTPVWREVAPVDPVPTPVPAITDIQPVFHEATGHFLFLTRFGVWSLDPALGQLVRERDPGYLDQRLEPAPRATPAQAMTWYDPDQQLVLRFGGFWVTPAEEPGGELGLERTNQVMAYSHELGVWVRMDTPDAAPSPRVRGAVAYDTKRERSVLFGGITGGLDERASDLWTFDAVSKRWTEHRASNAPGPRGGYFGMAYDEERDVFVVPFGRQDQDVFLDEVWRLSFDEEAWGTATWRFDREGWEPGLVPTEK